MFSKIFEWISSKNRNVAIVILTTLVIVFLLYLGWAVVYQPHGVIVGLFSGLLFG